MATSKCVPGRAVKQVFRFIRKACRILSGKTRKENAKFDKGGTKIETAARDERESAGRGERT
ncbi:MAG: hypothetical protein LBH75_05420 [Treponema sp.]|nr:hypothetical protein [Treponema sp.]